MKQIILLFGILSCMPARAQYSNYYSVDLNQNVNANIKVSGSVNVNKNISTIDYGQLAIANAQRERNRLENLKYADEREGNISLEIASDPIKAFDYGYKYTFTFNGQDAKQYGFKKFTISYIIPHKSLFVSAGAGRFENVSADGITTEIIFWGPQYNKGNEAIDIEKYSKMDEMKEGSLNDNGEQKGKNIFVHKKEMNRATIFGYKGFRSSLIWEDEYQYTITDNFMSFETNKGNGVLFTVIVRTYGDKDKVTFEKLEGRRYYLKRLVEKVVSTAVATDMKF